MRRLSLSPSACHAPLLTASGRLAFSPTRDLAAWRRALRRALVHATGLDRMPRPETPRVERLWKRTIELGTVEKLVLRSEPGADVPMFLCIPHGAVGRVPTMICLGGHHAFARASVGLGEDEETPVEVPGDRAFALGCLRRGLGALAVEQRSFGDRRELAQERRSFHNECHDAAMRALLLGRTLLGERVYDAQRALDFLVTDPRIDAARVGVMGNSGGGTISMWTAALDRRIALLIASCSFSSFRESIATIHHCADNYVPGVLTLAELPDIVGLVAPRPIVLVAGKDDPIFPLAGVQRAFARVCTIYRSAEAGAKARLVVGPEGHRFYEALAWDAAARVAPWVPRAHTSSRARRGG